MTVPFNPANGVPAPGQQTFPLPPGQATFAAPVPQQPTTIVRESQWQGYPASSLPPMPQPAAQQLAQGGGQPQQQQAWPAQPQPGQYQVGQPVPTQFVQPSTQPGQQFAPQAPSAQVPQGIDPNTVLQGPAFPPELQGVTLGQAIQLYGGMRNLVLNLQQRTQQQATPQPQAQAPQQQAPAPQNGQPAPFDWRNPAAGLAAIIGPMLDERLGPITQNAHQNAAAQARASVAEEVGAQRFAQLEPMVLRYLAGATPQDLANPELWRVATRTALGEMTLAQSQQQGQPQQTASQQYGGAVPFRPGMQNPAPPLQSFFTEAPQAGGQAVQGVTLSPQQMWFADQMGVSYADYAAYAQGIPSQNPNGGRR